MVQYILSGQRLYFPNKIVFLSLKIVPVSANSVDSDEMLHYAAFHLSLHFLPQSSHLRVTSIPNSKVFVWKKLDYVILVTPFHILQFHFSFYTF